MLPMLEKYEEIYGCYPKSPYAGGFRGSFVASLSLPTQGGLEGLLPPKIHPIAYQPTNRIIHHIIGVTPASRKEELRELYCAGEGNGEQQNLQPFGIAEENGRTESYRDKDCHIQ